MKKVMMVSYHTPPIAGAGTFRTLKFCKYLPESGFVPIVLTINRSNFFPVDPELEAELDSNMFVVRTRTLESKIIAWGPAKFHININWFLVPDYSVGWLPFAVQAGMKIINKNEVSVIYATGPPFTSMIIGKILSERSGLPLVVDFRDKWTQNSQNVYPTAFHQALEEKLELSITRFAAKVIFTSDFNQELFLSKYSGFDKSKCITINNGYDPEDFKGVERTYPKKFTISHIGSFYGTRSPDSFFSAVKGAMIERPEMSADLEILLMGKSSREFMGTERKYGLDDWVNWIDYAPHKKAIDLMVASACLLLVIGHGKGSEGVYTGKLFEYLAARRPILGILPIRGIAADLIKNTGRGRVADNNDIDGIKDGLIDLYTMWKSGGSDIGENVELGARFSRREQTKTLARVLENSESPIDERRQF